MQELAQRTIIDSMLQDKMRLLALIKTKSLEVGKPIKLASGKMSNMYIDAKMVTLDSEGAYLTAKVLFDSLENEEFDAIGGLTMGADPIVGAFAAYSYSNNRPISTFIVRKEPKKHGKQNWIEGPLKNNSKVIVIDDVTTTGTSLFQAIEKIEETGCKILKVITLVDRMEGAKEFLKEKGYKLESIFDTSDLLKASDDLH
jgi:orotate phosphoribosyltransferase